MLLNKLPNTWNTCYRWNEEYFCPVFDLRISEQCLGSQEHWQSQDLSREVGCFHIYNTTRRNVLQYLSVSELSLK